MLNYPKLLVISNNPFSNSHNNGKTLANLFKDWPKKRLAQLFFHPDYFPEWSVCYNYYKISDLDILKSCFLLSKNCGIKLEPNQNEKKNNKSKGKLSKWISRLNKQHSLIILLRDLIWKTGRWNNKQYRNWLTEFNPDIIFFVGGNSGFAHEVACWTAENCNIPLAVYFTDDYVLKTILKNPFDRYLFKQKKKYYQRTINMASLHFAIGDYMAFEYSKYYKKHFFSVMNCVEIENIKSLAEDPSRITFAYFGGLALNRWKSLIEIGDIINCINAELHSNICLEIYTTSHISESLFKLLNNSPLVFCGSIFGEKLDRKMREVNFLIHVESFDIQYRTATHYSISTKLPEYFSSGRCVIGYGPHEVASIRLLEEFEAGVVLTEKDSQEVKKNKVERIINEIEYRNRIINNAFDLAKTKFDAKQVRTNIRTLLEDTVLKK